MDEIATIEHEQNEKYPGLRVRRDGDAVVVHIPAKFRRRNGRFMVLTEGAGDAESGHEERQVNQTLVEALAKAHRWQQQLESGRFAGLDELAAYVGVDRSYVGRVLRLTSLAPDIIEAILRGDEPSGLSLEKLRRELAVGWGEQRGLLLATAGPNLPEDNGKASQINGRHEMPASQLQLKT